MPRRVLVVLGATVGFVLGLHAASPAAVLCKTRTGTVKIRDVCKPLETVVDPVALGLQGPPGSPGMTGPTGPSGPTGMTGPPGPGLVVKDANGTVVGSVLAPLLPVARVGLSADAGASGNPPWVARVVGQASSRRAPDAHERLLCGGKRAAALV